MVGIVALWLPILLSAVFVFFISALFHMVLPHHKSDRKALPDEDAVLDALGRLNIPAGDYMFPLPPSMEAMKSDAFKDKMRKGPVGVMTVFPPLPADNPTSMGRALTLWFVYCVIVSVFAAYISGRALGPGVDYLQVQRFAGCTAFLAYTLAAWQDSIWYRKSWGTTLKDTIDGLIYGLVTGGTFGWLWPR